MPRESVQERAIPAGPAIDFFVTRAAGPRRSACMAAKRKSRAVGDFAVRSIRAPSFRGAVRGEPGIQTASPPLQKLGFRVRADARPGMTTFYFAPLSGWQ